MSAKPAKAFDPVVHAFAKLQRRFPQTFSKNAASKVPLKIGIEDLVPHAQELSLRESELQEAILTKYRGTRVKCGAIEAAPCHAPYRTRGSYRC